MSSHQHIDKRGMCCFLNNAFIDMRMFGQMVWVLFILKYFTEMTSEKIVVTNFH